MFLLLLACNSSSPGSEASLPTMPAGPAPATAPEMNRDGSGVVASWTGGSLTYDELQAKTKTQVTMAEIEYLQGRYAIESQALEQASVMAVMDLEAQAQGKTVEELLAAEIDGKVSAPTEDEVNEFYVVVKRQLRNAPLETVRPQVEGMLMQRRQQERMGVYIEEMQAKYEVQTQLPYPDLPKIEVSADDDPVLGSADAQVTIVEFADYQCGYCRKVYPTLRELVDEYDGKVKVVYRDYPLSGGQGGMEPQIAANCAGEQGKYWEMHHELMVNSNYSAEAVNGYATTAGLDTAAFAACTASPELQYMEVMKDFEDGREVGVSGTPAFFVNGVFLNGAVPKEQFKAVIDRELEG